MADLATLETWRSEAEQALHDLQMGKRVEQIRYNERTLQYAQGSDPVKSLKAYIADLDDQIARKKGKGGRRPIQLWPA